MKGTDYDFQVNSFQDRASSLCQGSNPNAIDGGTSHKGKGRRDNTMGEGRHCRDQRLNEFPEKSGSVHAFLTNQSSVVNPTEIGKLHPLAFYITAVNLDLYIVDTFVALCFL